MKAPVSVRTLVEMLRARAQASPERTAFIWLEGNEREVSWSYGELDWRARAIAARLAGVLAPGDRAILIYPPGLDLIAGFFGCLYAGVIAVPVYPPRGARSYQRLVGILEGSGARAVLTTQQGLEMGAPAGDGPWQALHWIATSDLGGDGDGEIGRSVAAHDIAFLQYTSGSTSEPKGVALTHANLLDNLELIRRAFGNSSENVGVSWLPAYHDMGLIGTILQPIYVGAPTVLMSPLRFVQRPLRWLDAISRYRGTTCGGPAFAYALCVEQVSEEARAKLDLSSWNVAFCGAEPISRHTLERFAEAFAPAGFRSTALYPCYGLAEATVFVTGVERSSSLALCTVDAVALERGEVVPGHAAATRTLVGCGRPWGDTRVRIVDPETRQPSAPGRVGEIWVAGGGVAVGYWRCDEQTRATFAATLADGSEGGFLRTGDLGFLHDGQLYITGRLKDMIVIDGRNIYPQDVEQTVAQANPRARIGGTAAFSIDVDGVERLVVLHEVERQAEAELKALASTMRGRLADEHGLSAYSLAFIAARSLPKTSSGKVARRAGRADYLSGRLPIIGERRAEEWRWAA
jgi:acyl-CoA synthetase (AMP-forming)/AMP-acid ligase II